MTPTGPIATMLATILPLPVGSPLPSDGRGVRGEGSGSGEGRGEGSVSVQCTDFNYS